MFLQPVAVEVPQIMTYKTYSCGFGFLFSCIGTWQRRTRTYIAFMINAPRFSEQRRKWLNVRRIYRGNGYKGT